MSQFDKTPPLEYNETTITPAAEDPIVARVVKKEISPFRAACLGAIWSLVIIMFLAMGAAPIIVAYTLDFGGCVPQNVPSIQIWHLVDGIIWIFLILACLYPLYALIVDGKVKRGALLGLSIAALFILIVVAFSWSCIGAVTASYCYQSYTPSLIAYTTIGMVFSVALAIWVPIHICVWGGCCKHGCC